MSQHTFLPAQQRLFLQNDEAISSHAVTSTLSATFLRRACEKASLHLSQVMMDHLPGLSK